MTRMGLQKIVATAAVALSFTGVAMTGCSSTTVTGEGGTSCGTGSTQCGDTCTVVARDTQNCGACGKACAMGEVCSQGMCASACGGGTTKCGSECVDNKSDPRNCGMCGKACAANEVCMAGACASSCAMPTSKCGMACVNTQTDRTNCGMCGTLCKDGEVCSGGMCSISCQQGLTKCGPVMLDGGMPEGGADAAPPFPGDYCANLQVDNSNCGACGTACAAGQKCVNSACKYPTRVGQFNVGAGPLWSSNNTMSYTCLEACAVVFGGTATDYMCSTTANQPNNKAYVDCWGVTTNCTGAGVAETFKKGTTYNCGSSNCSCSAYVNDHSQCLNSANHCWKFQ